MTRTSTPDPSREDQIETLWRLLGSGPSPAPHVVVMGQDDCGDFVVETLACDFAGTPVRGFVTRPKAAGPYPAILYAHAHGKRYDIGARELLDGRPALLGPLGPVFARAGFVTLCIDMPCFGERAHLSEDAFVKQMLWHGRTVMGQMLGELSGALGYLSARKDVDAHRVGAFGLSMGATHAWMLAALDTRVSAVAHLCCYADLGTLIELDRHDLHGHYLTIPGFCAKTSVGRVAGLVAPRPQLICNGADDPLTPASAIERAFAETEACYGAVGAADRLRLRVCSGTGHIETEAMRRETLAFLVGNLLP